MSLWPRAIIAVFLVFAGVQFTLVRIAARHFEGPDDDRPVKHGLEQARALHENTSWTVTTNLPRSIAASQSFPLQVMVRDKGGRTVQGARAWVVLGRPATRSQDRRLPLPASQDGYATPLTLPGGTWDLTFTVKRDGLTAQHRVRLRANP